MENKTLDLSARLLATENLTVVRAAESTASFDIKSRILTLPLWKDMTPEIETMLVGHEVGHALYTGLAYIEPIKENPKMASYMNVLEDVRIEKLIKRKYPGLRKHMTEGYRQLNDRDFFGVKKLQSLDNINLIDKINLYFKAGFSCGVKFNAVESEFVKRAELTETVADVVALAKEIYEYSKEQAEAQQQIQQTMQASAGDDEGDADQDSFDYEQADSDSDIEGDVGEDGDDEEQPQQPKRQKSAAKAGGDEASKGSETESQIDTSLESKTDKEFHSKLSDLADTSTRYTYWKFSNVYSKDQVIGYKRILAETRSPEEWTMDDLGLRGMPDNYCTALIEKSNKEFQEFKTESTRIVNYLVKEFEMKKSASMFKRAQVSKLGSLDMRKIYSYKLKDDLFKRATVVSQGKNHGMVMLLDWSGSMDRVINDTIKQVVNLAMFCRRVQIPFRVYAFTDGYHDKDYTSVQSTRIANDSAARKEAYIDALDNMTLLELFSDKMSTTDFNSMMKRVTDVRFLYNKNYSLGGTPLNEALVWIYNNIGEFIKDHNLEKATFITLTDGEGSRLYPANTSFGSLSSTGRDYNTYENYKKKHFIRDDVTKKTYSFTEDANEQTATILSMIKDRYAMSMVGFYICENSSYHLNSFVRSNLPNYPGDRQSLVYGWRENLRKDGFVSVKNTGRDELFIINKTSTKIKDEELELDGSDRASTIARNFGKYLNTKRTSRVLLTRFIDLIA